jgi:hypothetical protein
MKETKSTSKVDSFFCQLSRGKEYHNDHKQQKNVVSEISLCCLPLICFSNMTEVVTKYIGWWICHWHWSSYLSVFIVSSSLLLNHYHQWYYYILLLLMEVQSQKLHLLLISLLLLWRNITSVKWFNSVKFKEGFCYVQHTNYSEIVFICN